MDIFWLGFWGAVGAVVGSFINMFAYRYPKMVQRTWEANAREVLGLPEAVNSALFNLAWPASHCPSCATALRWWHNIPVVSYLLLKGRCGHCRAPIGTRYLTTELLASGLGVAGAYAFPGSWTLLPLTAGWLLLAAAIIDWETEYLFDELVLPALWLGLLTNQALALTTSGSDALWGAAVGYATFLLLEHAFQLLTRRDGLGRGDAKLLAALGAWVGVFALPYVIVIASTTVLLMAAWRRRAQLAFGPALLVGGLGSLAISL